MKIFKFLIIITLITHIFGCTEKTTYSGKIFKNNELLNLNIKDKEELIEILGLPSYFDDIQNKYFYFTEKNKTTNFFNKKTEYSYLFVFELNKENKVIDSKSINLLEEDLSKFLAKETPNNIVERGLIEKIFGGVGAKPLPNNNL